MALKVIMHMCMKVKVRVKVFFYYNYIIGGKNSMIVQFPCLVGTDIYNYRVLYAKQRNKYINVSPEKIAHSYRILPNIK